MINIKFLTLLFHILTKVYLNMFKGDDYLTFLWWCWVVLALFVLMLIFIRLVTL